MKFVEPQNDVNDCHRAVTMALEKYNAIIDPTRVALIGQSYGGFIAMHLAIKEPSMYKAVVLTNPIVNLAAMASASTIPDLAWQLLGENFTQSSVASDIYIEAWNR